ncbi:hypothetical protein ACIPUC_02585 [Streptomyces sp. LARHCF249]
MPTSTTSSSPRPASRPPPWARRTCATTSAAYAHQDKRADAYVQQFGVQGLRHLAAGAGVALSPQGTVTGLGAKCLDVKGGKAVNDTQIQLYAANTNERQAWVTPK